MIDLLTHHGIGRGLVAALMLSLGLTPLAGAQTPTDDAPAPAAPAADEKPQETRVLQERSDRLLVQLPNRLLVLVQEVPTAPVVSAQVWVKTGSVYEQEHVGAGLSHFLEHLVSGGTTRNRTEAESNAILGRIGAKVNAATSLDNVHYYINTTRPYAADAVELLSDWMRHSVIPQEEYERERQVIQKEFAMGQGEPGRIFWKLTQQARYQHHPARHPTIGYLDEFLQISRGQIYDFYQRMYVPNNMVFVVAGDVDKEQIVEQITQLWSDAKPRELPELSLPIEDQVAKPVQAVGTASLAHPRLRLAWPGTRIASDGDYALDLLGQVLGGGESSRLVRKVRDEMRLVNAIDAYNLSFPWGEGFFGIDAEIAPADRNGDGKLSESDQARSIDAVRKAVLDQVERIRLQGVTEEELARAKRQALARSIYAGQSAQGLASQMARNLIGMGDPDYRHRYVQAIDAITAEDLQRAAERFLQPQRMIDLTLVPAPEGAEPQPLARPEEAPAEDLRVEDVELDNLRVAERVLAQRGRDDVDRQPTQVGPLVETTLPNGLKLILQRNTLIPAVSVQYYQPGGLLSDEPGREGLANATASMLMKGTKTRSAQEIAQTLEDLGAGITTNAANNTSYIRGLALKEDFPTVLELVADVLLNPAFPEDEWARLQPRLLAAIDRVNDQWASQLRSEFRQAYYGNHPWSQLPVGRREVVASLTVEDLRQFHESRLGASGAVITVMGDIDVEEVQAQLESLFGDMPEQAPVRSLALDPQAPKPGLQQVTTNKPLAAVQIGFGPGIRRDHPDYAALQVLSRMMSSFPTGWLEQQLRGQGAGLVYAVGAGNVTGMAPGYFSILFNSQPDSAVEALERTMAVVHRARTELADEQQLARARASVLTDEFLYKQTLGDRAADAALADIYGLGADASEQFIQNVAAVDAQALRRVAEQYLVNPVAIVLTSEPLDQAALEAALAGPDAEGDTPDAPEAEAMQTSNPTR